MLKMYKDLKLILDKAEPP